jgi:hypothetical protein
MDFKEREEMYFIGNFVFNETMNNGGSTYNLKSGNMVGKEFYAVSDKKEKEVVLSIDKFDEESVVKFIESNYELLQNPEYSLGTWKNGDLVYIDISRTIKGVENALEIARRENQTAIFNRDKNEYL